MTRTRLFSSVRLMGCMVLGTCVLSAFGVPSCFADDAQDGTQTPDSTGFNSASLTRLSTVNPVIPDPRVENAGSVTAISVISAGAPPIEGRRPTQGVNWIGVFRQSASFLAIEQGFRLVTQPGTREALKGKFFDDWFESVKATHGWGDGDDFLTNYIGHPMQGSVSGYIFVQNDSRGRTLQFSRDSSYWHSRLKAMAWSALYSTQFELGPVSEASIGNVGHYGGSLSGAVDLVVTPLAGFGWQVSEDALDKYLVVKIENKTQNPVVLMFARSVLNPTRSFANMMRLMVPWNRDTRPGIWGRSSGNR